MIKTFEELKKLVSKTVVIERRYAGWVTFDVVCCHEQNIEFKSHVSGFDFAFVGDDAVKEFEEYANVEPIFATIDDAYAFNASRRQETINDFFAKHEADKEQFAKEMIRKAYNKELDPEYGDYDIAQGIKKVAALHYPDLTL